MALKDLVASKASLAEDVIEEIVSDHIRFDPDSREIVFTPDAHGLSNKAKVLIYLVALQGWPYVAEEVIPADAKPAEIEERTGIPGGSLRPLLMELKDRNVVVEKGGRYSVRAAALRAIQKELDGGASATAHRAKRRPKRETVEVAGEPDEKTIVRKRSRAGSTAGAGTRFQSWIEEGYFDTPRTLSDVQQRFHKEAIIVPQSSLPKHLLKGVRSGQLAREKVESNGKIVWSYKRSKR